MLDLGLPQATRMWSARVLRLGSFQGESQLYCYEVVPQQQALSPGKPCPPHSHPLPFSLSSPPRSLLPAHPDSPPLVSPTVTQCLLESVLRGSALVPRRALAVMGCEVLRVLQLSDTAIVPISFHVPRKVRVA